MTARTRLTLITLFAALLGVAGTTLAGDKGKPDKAHKHMQQQARDHGDRQSGGLFSDRDRQIIVEYFHGQPMTAKPLPPGIAKNYARGKPLPPGIAKRYLPGELVQRLPARHGYEYAVVGADVVLIELATQLVVDVLVDVLL